MFCKNCGKQIADDAKFCPECGTSNETATSVVTENTEKAIDQKKKVSAKIIVAVVLVAVLLIGVICAVAFSSKNKDEGANKDGAADITYLDASDEDFGLLCDLFAEMQCFADSYSCEDNDANYIAVNAVTDISSKFYSVCCEKYGLNDKELFWNSESESDPEKQYTVADEGYAKYSVEDVDWIVKNIFNVEPEKDRYIADPYNTGEEYCFWYKNEGSYYSPLYIFDGRPSFDAAVNNHNILSDGKYCMEVTVYEIELGEPYPVSRFEITAGLKEVDGKRVWSFDKWDRLPDKQGTLIEAPVIIPDKQTSASTTTTTTVPNTTTAAASNKPSINGDRQLYYDYFYSSKFSNSDIICFVDVTHDGKDDMLVGNITSRGWEKLYIFTIKNENVEKIKVFTTLGNPKETVFLTSTSGKCNIVMENKDVHRGSGTASFTEFYVTDTGEMVEVDGYKQPYGLEENGGIPVPYEDSERAYQKAVTQRYGEGYSKLYYFYNNEFEKQNSKFFDVAPVKVFFG